MTYLGHGDVQFRVYTPIAGKRWTLYQARWWRAPFVWLLWLVRGIRTRLVGPPLGRAVTLADLLLHHPGKPGKCQCRGKGVITEWRKGEAPGLVEGVRLCERMLAVFRVRAAWRIADAEDGPRWVRGFAPEELVGASSSVK